VGAVEAESIQKRIPRAGRKSSRYVRSRGTSTGDHEMVAIYICALVIANLSVAYFGPWVSPINAFLLIGLDLSLRDKLHEKWKNNLWSKMISLIVVAGAISYVLNPAAGKIALASVIAFILSGLVDAFVYQKLKHKSWMIKSNGSNTAGALVDSMVFPTIAFGGLMPMIVLLQFAAKVSGGAIWAWVLNDPLSRNANHTKA
jgi:uncharacterized PurR-regulated membrane protein YhhQ (DUF165 family)